MKSLLKFTMAALLALSLSACATVGPKADQPQVKCPACGYEFTPPMGG